MSAAVLTILGDASGVKRALGEAIVEARRASAAISAQSRAESSVRRQQLSNDGAMARAQLREEGATRRAAQAERGRQDRAAQAARERGTVRETALARRAAAEVASIERTKTTAASRESAARTLAASREATAKMNLADREAARAEADERRKTSTAGKEERRRTSVAEAEARKRVRAAIAAAAEIAQAAGQFATNAHGQVQEVRQVIADRTSAINTSLLQRGTSEAENAADNERIQARVAQARTGVSPDIAIRAIAHAQSFASALGGDTPEARREAIDSTLSDVEFAGAVDPTNVDGIVNMGAVLRRKVHDPAMRRRILRSAVGTSFDGSVETNDMIGGGLQGLLGAISSGTANVTSTEERDRITAEISADYFAQLQAQAAGGRSVGVSANRTNTVRTALSNAPRQNRMGLALAETARTGTPEQQAAFASAFTKGADGQYTMSADVRDTPSNAARFLGTMFNNDDSALRNFMGANGGGGPRQLMNIPDVAAISSYFGMTTGRNGNAIREYDHVNELKAATVTPEQEAVLTRTRAGEDRTRLMQEEEHRREAIRTRGAPTLTSRASDAATTFANEHPWISALGATVGSSVLGMGAKAVGGKVVAALGAAPAAIALGSAVGGTALASYGSSIQASTGVGPDGRPLSTGERVGKGLAATVGPALFPGAALITAIQELTTAAREFRRGPIIATVSPHDSALAGAGNGSSPNMPPTP